MKYTITNKQLHNLMTNHLNVFKDNRDVSRFNNFIVISMSHDNDGFNDVIIEYDHEDGRLFIDEYFIKDFISWFPLDEESAQEFIKNWFEETFDVKIKYTQS